MRRRWAGEDGQKYCGTVRARDDGGRLGELLASAEAMRRAGRLAAARSEFLIAAAEADREHDEAGLVEAALGVGGIWVHENRDLVAWLTVQELWNRAQALVSRKSLAGARLAVRVAAEAVYQGGPTASVLRAVEDVRSHGDDAATAEALSLLHHVQLGPREAAERLGLATEIVRLGVRGGDSLITSMGLCWRTADLFLLGDLRAGQSLQELRERAKAEDCEAIGFIADVLAAMLLARAGRLADAEAAATAARDRGSAAGDPDAMGYYAALLVAMRWWQGRAGEVVELVRSISASPRVGLNHHAYVAADAVLSAVVGDVDAAEEALARIAGIGLGAVPDSSSWLTTQALVAEAAYLLGDAEVAAESGRLLAPFADMPVMASLAVVCLGSTERALGLCAVVTGHLDAAVEHLDSALRANRRLRNRPMAALTEHTLAGVLVARGRQGDQARGAALAQRAREHAIRWEIMLPSHPSWLERVRMTSALAGAAKVAWLEPCQGGWRVEVDDRATILAKRVGLSYLATLIRHPDRSHEANGLASPMSLSSGGVRDAVLDRSALRSYRARTVELEELISQPGLAPHAADCLRTELAALRAEVRAATGLGGRVRVFPDDQERARTAVRKALVRAIESITSVEPELGRHLSANVTTGATCRYSCGSDWSVSVRIPLRRLDA